MNNLKLWGADLGERSTSGVLIHDAARFEGLGPDDE